jgi:hypothetical protein
MPHRVVPAPRPLPGSSLRVNAPGRTSPDADRVTLPGGTAGPHP